MASAHHEYAQTTFVSEYRLGFGLSVSSGIAQRFAEGILGIFRSRFDAQEEQIIDSILREEPTSKKAAWIRRRRKISEQTGKNECRLYNVLVYTKDPVFSVVEVQRFIRALKAWKELTMELGLRTAIARKRQIGTAVEWLGFHFYLNLGCMIAPEAKRSRALERIHTLLSP